MLLFYIKETTEMTKTDIFFFITKKEEEKGRDIQPCFFRKGKVHLKEGLTERQFGVRNYYFGKPFYCCSLTFLESKKKKEFSYIQKKRFAKRCSLGKKQFYKEIVKICVEV